MGMLYVIDNFISSDTPLYASSMSAAAWVELALIYNKRPSKPYRWEGQGTPAVPEWICVDLLQDQRVTFCGIFNHNFLLTGSADLLEIKNCNLPCPGISGGCDWDAADTENLMDRLVNNFRNLYEVIDFTNRYVTLEIVDQDNPYPIEAGDWVLGVAEEFTNAKLQPYMADGPSFKRTRSTTHYGQNWQQSLSEAYSFDIEIIVSSAANQVDELQYFLRRVHNVGGSFVFIPREDLPFAYYVFIENEVDFANQLARGRTRKAYSYKLKLKTLTEGISML